MKKFRPYKTKTITQPQQLEIDSETGAAILRTNPTRKHPSYRLLVDPKNFLWLSQMTWTPAWQKSGKRADGRTNHVTDHLYFNTSIRRLDGRYRNALMHRLIMGSPRGKLVGFVNHDYFDLRESQLSIVTQKQVNERMRKTTKPTASRFKGVSLEWRSGKPRRYLSQASHNNRVYRIGIYPPTQEGMIAAAHAYDLHVLANYTNPQTNYPVDDYAGVDLGPYVLSRHQPTVVASKADDDHTTGTSDATHDLTC